MISGYFLISSDTVKIKKVLLTVFEVSVPISIITFILIVCSNCDFLQNTADRFAYAVNNLLFPISSEQWWFVTTYVFLILLSPGINILVRDLDKHRYIELLVFVYLWLYVMGNINSHYREIYLATFFYLLGGFQSQYRAHIDNKLMCTIGVLFVWFIGAILCYFSSLSSAGALQLIVEKICDTLQIAIIAPIAVILIFNLFLSIDVTQCSFINKVASHTFGVYLLHDSLLGRHLFWYTLFHVTDVQYRSRWFPVLALLTVLFVFFFCVLLDSLRCATVDRLVNKYIGRTTLSE